MASNNIGVPATTNEETARERGALALRGARLTNRARAILEQAFDLAETRKSQGGKPRYVETLAKQLEEDPLDFLERLSRLLPQQEAPASSSAPGGINALFLQAVQLANGHGAGGKIIDAVVVTTGTTRVHDDASDW